MSEPIDHIDFTQNPDIPQCPTDEELVQFYAFCAEVMHAHPTTPLVMALKGGISIIVSMRAEIEMLRGKLGLKQVSPEEAVEQLGSFLKQVRGD